MKRRAAAALPLLLASLALAGGLESVPRAAPLLAGLSAAAALAAAFGSEAPPAWFCALAAFSAASAARLLGLWCADPSLGFALTAAAGAAGALVAAAGPAPRDEAAALAWAAAGGMLIAGEPVLLGFLGANTAVPGRLFLATRGGEVFLLGQPALLAAAAAAAFAQAARGLARPARGRARVAAFAGAFVGAALVGRVDASGAVGAAGGALALFAAVRARPWAAERRRAMTTRLLASAAVAAALLAAASPGALRRAWTARLDSIYPGGKFLAVADDGDASWAAYEFSLGDRVLLRDGLIQRDDASASLVALTVALGQAPRADCAVLIADPPGPQSLLAAQGCRLGLDDGSTAEAAARDAELGERWRTRISTDVAAYDAAVVYLPLPWNRAAQRRTTSAALKALRARLAPDGSAAFVLPAFAADDRSLDELEASAAAAFGAARSGRLNAGEGLVVAARTSLAVEPAILLANLASANRGVDSVAASPLLAAVRWRPGRAPK